MDTPVIRIILKRVIYNRNCEMYYMHVVASLAYAPYSLLLPLGPPQTRVKKRETRNKKQNGLAHSRFIVCVTPKQKKNIA